MGHNYLIFKKKMVIKVKDLFKSYIMITEAPG